MIYASVMHRLSHCIETMSDCSDFAPSPFKHLNIVLLFHEPNIANQYEPLCWRPGATCLNCNRTLAASLLHPPTGGHTRISGHAINGGHISSVSRPTACRVSGSRSEWIGRSEVRRLPLREPPSKRIWWRPCGLKCQNSLQFIYTSLLFKGVKATFVTEPQRLRNINDLCCDWLPSGPETLLIDSVEWAGLRCCRLNGQENVLVSWLFQKTKNK